MQTIKLFIGLLSVPIGNLILIYSVVTKSHILLVISLLVFGITVYTLSTLKPIKL
jgi:hypothetical protein